MPYSEKESDNESGRKNSAKQIPELDVDYAVSSRIANGRSMTNMEGYPVIARTVFDPVHSDPDESEYCSGTAAESGDFQDAGEGYALHRKMKSGYD